VSAASEKRDRFTLMLREIGTLLETLAESTEHSTEHST